MAGQRRQPPSEHQSWKQSRRSPSGRGPATSRAGQRWFFTLAALLLVATFTAILAIIFFGRTMQTHFFVLAEGNYHNLSLPHIPWHAEDLNVDARPRAKRLAVLNASRLLETDNRFSSELASNVATRDCVIFYAAAHAVPNTEGTGVDLVLLGNKPCSLARLLDQIRRFPAKTKLLVLDCGRLVTDVRAGLLANNFPELLVAQANAATDSDTRDPVWILASHDSCQADTGWYGRGRTLFGDSVVDGLTGAADHDGDSYVDLVELYSYTLERCRQESGGAQTPLLVSTAPATERLAIPPAPLIALSAAPKNDSEADSPTTSSVAAAAANKASDRAKSAAASKVPPPAKSVAVAAQSASGSGSGSQAENPPSPSGGPSPQANGSPASADAPAAATAAADPTTPPDATASTASGPVASGSPSGDAAGAAPPSTATDATPPAPPASSPADPAPSSVAAQYAQLLDQGWQLRDQLQSETLLPEGSGGYTDWSPVEYMPHLWRELNALLVDYELLLQMPRDGSVAASDPASDSGADSATAGRATGGTARMEAKLQELASLVEELKHLQQEMSGQPRTAAGGQGYLKPLLDWYRNSRQHPNRAEFDPESTELKRVADGLRQSRRVQFQLAYFVQWQGTAMWVAPESDSQGYDKIVSQIGSTLDQLNAYQGWLDEHRDRALDPAEMSQWLRQQEAVGKEYQALVESWEKWIESLVDSPGQPRDYVCGEVALASPLLTAEQRRELRRWLANRPAAALPEKIPQVSEVDLPSADVIPRTMAERLRYQARWQVALAKLAGRDLKLGETEPWWDFSMGSGQGTVSWTAVRQTSRLLQQEMATAVRELKDASSASGMSMACLQWIDGREKLRAQSVTHLQLPIGPPPVEERLVWKVGPPETLLLQREEQLVEFQVATTADRQAQLRVQLQYDASLLRVQSPEGTWLNGQWRDFQFNDGSSVPIQFTVASRLDPQDATQLPEIKVSVESGALPRLSAPIALERPRPNEVLLFVDHHARGGAKRCPVLGADRDVIEVSLFPNRENVYTLSLQNPTAEPKSVSVQLLKIDGGEEGRGLLGPIPPGQIVDKDQRVYEAIRAAVFSRTGALGPRPKVIAKSNGVMELQPNETKTIDFSKPAPMPPADAAATPAPVPAPAPEPQPAESIDYGLACVITDQTDPSQRWVRWLQWRTISPAEYTNFASKVDNGLLVGTLSWRSDAALRPDVIAKPVELNWDISQTDRDITPLLLNSLLHTEKATLNGNVPPGFRGNIQMWVDVDGCPRTFKHTMQSSDGQTGRDQTDRRLARIAKVQLSGSKRVYHLRRGFPPAPDPAELEVIELERLPSTERTRQVVFATPQEDQRLLVRFEVDAPIQRFDPQNPIDVVTFRRLNRDNQDIMEPLRYYRQRQQRVYFQEAAAGGRMVLDNNYSDYVVEVPIYKATSGVNRLHLQLELGSADAGAQLVAQEFDTLDVLFDNDIPRISDAVRVVTKDRKPPVETEEFHVQFSVADMSGEIASAQYGFVKSKIEPLAEPKDATRVGSNLFGLRFEGPLTAEKAGNYFIKIVATDVLGKTRESVHDVRVVPKPMIVEPPKVDKGTVRGRVVVGSKPLYPAKVTLEGPEGGKTPVEVKPDGTFAFSNLPFGTYTLTAEGYGFGGPRKGTASVKLDKPLHVVEIPANL